MTSLGREALVHWYAIHTHAKQEERAESNLRAWNIETFVPRYQSRRRSQLKSEANYLIRPLFPRYIFARFAADDTFHKIRYTRGVHSVVSVGGTPAPLDDALIALIKARQDEDGFVKLGDSIEMGDEVIVQGGNFNGFVGVFERRMKDSGRVMILLKTATYRVRVIVPETNVMKVPV